MSCDLSGSIGVLQPIASAGTPTQTPDSQASSVHWLPSPPAAPSVTGVPMHTPDAHWSPSVQVLPSSHVLPSGSAVQVDEQQSPSMLLPSSQSSPGSRRPSPHGGPMQTPFSAPVRMT